MTYGEGVVTNYGLVKAASAALLAAGCSSANPSDWSTRERGTAIGGASGAVLGGVIGNQSDNTAAGAVIGGAVGAGAGHLIGREMEKRDEEDDYYRSRRRYDRGYEEPRAGYGGSLADSDARSKYLERGSGKQF